MNKIIKENIETINEVREKHFVKCLYVFGSASSSTMNVNSDVDFLYEIDIENFKGWSDGEYDYSMNFTDLQIKLKNILGRRVDHVKNRQFRNKYFNAFVESNKTMIYGGKGEA